ncbi:hepatoma-derived growth factor-related protein 2-like [Fopius arisanus]|uniref:Hepatoma-derived growth factor-related protein 2-like n=1 Tax=Fopius arisanus TaxID=64838 RepID=A0A9R1TQZ1_9HYME|nr:PREDICTED: hepatoma-derived growth factor-related protein 2-like [Fopius arisanus]XP_011313248.1 PREDICTED: hepatoma-derived growth factor-related protein 2-like [Fopius arisanus]XP_011313249.1 PREDICTED: hepatoma-derived growth factor-related protein 2-like [Fopius arisanus]
MSVEADQPTSNRISTCEVTRVRQFIQKLETSKRMKRDLRWDAIESISFSDRESEIGSFTDSDDDDAWDAPTPLDPDTISPNVGKNVDDSPESSAPVEKEIIDSPASPDLESPESSAPVEKEIVDSPASPDPESPESPPPEGKGLGDLPSPSSDSSMMVVEDSDSMEIDPPDSTISEVAPVIPANIETALSNSADDTEPFVRVGETVCPPADDSDDDVEPVRILVPEEWEGVMPERAMKKKLRDIINSHYKVGASFVTMGEVRAKLIFCPHGNIFFRPMGSFKHPKRWSTNIKIYSEL